MLAVLMLSFFTAIYLSVSLLLDFLRAESNLIENRMIEIRENDSDFGRESSSLQGKEKRELNLSFIHVSKRLEEELDISGLNIKGEEFIFLWILIAVVPAFLFFSIICLIFLYSFYDPPNNSVVILGKSKQFADSKKNSSFTR